MYRAVITGFLAVLLWAGWACAQSKTVPEVVDMMVRLCVGGGHTEVTTAGGTGEANLSLRSLDIKGNLTGDYHIKKSDAEGLVGGLDNAISQVAADQADKVRVCLQPVRERLLDILLPVPKPTPPAPTPDTISQGGGEVGKVFGGRPSPTNAMIYEFVEITHASRLDTRFPFTYDGHSLKMISTESRIGLDISRPEDGMIYKGVIAQVVGISEPQK